MGLSLPSSPLSDVLCVFTHECGGYFLFLVHHVLVVTVLLILLVVLPISHPSRLCPSLSSL